MSVKYIMYQDPKEEKHLISTFYFPSHPPEIKLTTWLHRIWTWIFTDDLPIGWRCL